GRRDARRRRARHDCAGDPSYSPQPQPAAAGREAGCAGSRSSHAETTVKTRAAETCARPTTGGSRFTAGGAAGAAGSQTGAAASAKAAGAQARGEARREARSTQAQRKTGAAAAGGQARTEARRKKAGGEKI